MLLHLTDGNGWEQRLVAYARLALAPAVQQSLAKANISGFSPDIEALQSFDRRPGGAALTTYGLKPGRVLRSDSFDPESVAELEVHEDGGLRLFTSRLSDVIRSNSDQDPDAQVVFDAALVIYTRRLAAAAAAEEAGYFGNWALAVGATGLSGCRSFTLSQNWISRSGDRYSGDTYRRATVATYAELTRRPGQLADRLIGQLLRGFGTRQLLDAALTDVQPDQGPPA